MENNTQVKIPDGWNCQSLEKCTVDGGYFVRHCAARKAHKKCIPVIRVNNFNNGTLDLINILKISPDVEKKYSGTDSNYS